MGKLNEALRRTRSNVNLFRSITQCRVLFDPYDHKSVSAREFLRRLNSPRVRRSNPRLEVQTVISDSGGHGGAHLSIKFHDGNILELEPSRMSVREIERKIAQQVPLLTLYRLLQEEPNVPGSSR
ncbi:hypothetical protein CCYA_CCYA12G3355 [Cyanidiococcus yangmingshanensis]|nr:hypothetical protein CCYA_CCYA12G3355 [Cyanidiococcus yangmingshanensis]